jgi:type I restriction enzyme, S subunit
MSEMHFMEKLLNGVEVEWKALGDESFIEIANSGRKPVKASLRLSGKTPYYGANNIQDYVEGYTHDGEFLLIAAGSAEPAPFTVILGVGNSPQIEPQILPVLTHSMHYAAGYYCNHTATLQ